MTIQDLSQAQRALTSIPATLKTPVVVRVAGIDTKAAFQPISTDRVGR